VISEKKPIGTKVDKLLLIDEGGGDPWHLFVHEWLASRDGYDGRTTFLGCRKAFFGAETSVENFFWIVDLSTSGTAQVAAKQGLKHQHQRIPFSSVNLLVDDITCERKLLNERYPHD
jgi:hypothetical protein